MASAVLGRCHRYLADCTHLCGGHSGGPDSGIGRIPPLGRYTLVGGHWLAPFLEGRSSAAGSTCFK